MTRYKAEIMERMGHYETSVSVRAGSSKVFVGFDVANRFAGADLLISADDALALADHLALVAHEVKANIAADAAAPADLETSN